MVKTVRSIKLYKSCKNSLGRYMQSLSAFYVITLPNGWWYRSTILENFWNYNLHLHVYAFCCISSTRNNYRGTTWFTLWTLVQRGSRCKATTLRFSPMSGSVGTTGQLSVIMPPPYIHVVWLEALSCRPFCSSIMRPEYC